MNFINDLIAYVGICHNGLKVVMEKLKHRFVCNRLSLHSSHANGMDSPYSKNLYTSLQQHYTNFSKYGTAQMQFHTCVHVLACLHACANMYPVTSDETLASLTCCTHMLHKGLHTRVCCSSGYIHRYVHIRYSRVAYMYRAVEG